MRIALLHDAIPFNPRPIDEVAERCAVALRGLGHDARLVRIPRVNQAATQLMAANLVIRGAERVIGLSFPAYLLRAPGAERMTWALDAGPEDAAEANLREFLTASRLYCADRTLANHIESTTRLRPVLLAAPALEDDEGWRTVAVELAS
jgi:hypothetical protein